MGAAIALLGGLLWLGGTPAQAYKLAPLPQHEAMTMLAEACLVASGSGAVRCDREPPLRALWRQRRRELRRALRRRRQAYRDAGERVRRWELRDQVGSRRFSALARYTRWPDNPERMPIAPTFVYVAGIRCGAIRERVGDRAPSPGEARLTCVSHYLDLQFFHAMASVPRDASGRPVPPGPDQPTESTASTRGKLRAWLSFNFEIAAGRVDPEAELCASAERVAPGSELPQALRVGVGCGGSVGDLFLRRGKRHRVPGDIRQIATGAILHAIQDGFSQSHVQRSAEAPESFRPIVRCRPATAFYENTDGHLQHQHGKADTWPAYEGCDDGPIVDVLTASALAIRAVESGDREAFEVFVGERVLGR